MKLIYKKHESKNSLHNKPIDVEDDTTAYVDISFVPLRFGPMRNLHEIQTSSGEVPQETRLTNTESDNFVSVIRSNMLDEYQVHKKVDDLSHEDIESDICIVDVDSHDRAFKDVKTQGQSVICKNENILLVCTSKNDISPQNGEDQSTNRDSEKHFVSLISAETNVNWFLNSTSDSVILRDSEGLLLDTVVGSRTMLDA